VIALGDQEQSVLRLLDDHLFIIANIAKIANIANIETAGARFARAGVYTQRACLQGLPIPALCLAVSVQNADPSG
jgi:hypothetical protein